MIKLTKSNNGKAVFVVPESINAIEDVDGATRLDIPHSLCFVSESPEEVARKVLEYKLLMLRYPLSVDSGSHDHVRRNTRELRTLAGLEESQ